LEKEKYNRTEEQVTLKKQKLTVNLYI